MPSTLPTEILRLVIEAVEDYAQLRELLLISRQFHQLVEPVFLQNVEIVVKSPRRTTALISFHKFIRASDIHQSRRRRTSIKSFSVYFPHSTLEPSLRDLEVIDELLPTFTNLHSLHIQCYTSPIDSNTPLSLLSNAAPTLSLKRFGLHTRDRTINISAFLKSQPSIEHLELWLRPFEIVSIPSLRNLTSLSGTTTVALIALQTNSKIAHLRTAFLESDISGSGLSNLPHLENIRTLSCTVFHENSLRVFLPQVKNLKYLEITIYRNWSMLASIRNTSITHIRFLLDSLETATEILQLRDTDAFPPSLQCIEVQGTVGRGASRKALSPRSSRWYRGQPEPVTVEWTCPVDEIWCHDWERDVRMIG